MILMGTVFLVFGMIIIFITTRMVIISSFLYLIMKSIYLFDVFGIFYRWINIHCMGGHNVSFVLTWAFFLWCHNH